VAEVTAQAAYDFRHKPSPASDRTVRAMDLSLEPVSRTLWIPLVGRALARQRRPDLGFSDPESERILASFESRSALKTLEEDATIVWGSIRRTQVFDELTGDFLRRNRGATVLNLGAGLCTRFSRVDDGQVRWIDVDRPQVIGLRRRLMRKKPRQELIAVERVEREAGAWTPAANGPVLVIAEGLLMFLEGGGAERLLSELLQRLPAGSECLFDYIHPWFVTRPILRPKSMKAVGAQYRWGVRDLQRHVAPGYDCLSVNRFTERLGLATRLAAHTLARAMGGPLFDVAHLRVRAGYTAR
jgi:O-methyltransferase involved in polyketide biosynthesis